MDIRRLCFFVEIAEPFQKKRKYPLSEEQCKYLEKVLTPDEIQLVREMRQVSEEGRRKVIGYIDHLLVSEGNGKIVSRKR